MIMVNTMADEMSTIKIRKSIKTKLDSFQHKNEDYSDIIAKLLVSADERFVEQKILKVMEENTKYVSVSDLEKDD
jgi:predicted RNA-binding protein with PUA domain